MEFNRQNEKRYGGKKVMVHGIHMKTKKVAVAAILGLALVMGLPVAVHSNMTGSNPYVAYAKTKKKDKKKPVIKLSGKSTMTVEAGKPVKIPKATAKDNVDGNVTKKIKITVKKKNKKFSSLAKKIKNNKMVKFASIGDYEIIYKVTDKAGNTATKKRKIEVINKENIPEPLTEEPTTQEITTEVTTEQPTTEATTEKVTTEATTEKVTTETPTTEQPTTDPKYKVDYSEFNLEKEIINGRTYNISRSFDFNSKFYAVGTTSDKISLNIKADYDRLQFDANSGLANNSQYLKFLESITATDENGNDISDNIVIYEFSLSSNESSIINGTIYGIAIYVEDVYGNKLYNDLKLCLKSFDETITRPGYDDPKDLILLSESPLVYGRPRVEENDLSSDEE